MKFIFYLILWDSLSLSFAYLSYHFFFFFQAEDGIRDTSVTGVQTCALPILLTNAGQVQYHGLPNHSFDSTIGLVRALIDNFPEDFDKKKPSKPHGSMNMGGMEIGRASCRERVWRAGGAGGRKEK